MQLIATLLALLQKLVQKIYPKLKTEQVLIWAFQLSPKPLKYNLKKLAKFQRKFAKTELGSKRREKAQTENS